MKDPTLIFILLCILFQITFWIATAFSTKKVSENRGGWTIRITAIVIVSVLIFLRKQIAIFIPIMDDIFWPHSLIFGLVADVIVFMGVAIMIWARVILGKNWSANVVLKEDHDLITSGPYKYVRHPIYTGVVLIILGLAVYSGSFVGFLLFAIFFFGAYYKAHKEEKLLIQHFSERYIDYKKHVHTLIPFLF